MALLLGCLLSCGVQVGPLLIKNNPDIFWGVVSSMYIGNIMLLVLNLPLIGLWVKILKVPYTILGDACLARHSRESGNPGCLKRLDSGSPSACPE